MFELLTHGIGSALATLLPRYKVIQKISIKEPPSVQDSKPAKGESKTPVAPSKAVENRKQKDDTSFEKKKVPEKPVSSTQTAAPSKKPDMNRASSDTSKPSVGEFKTNTTKPSPPDKAVVPRTGKEKASVPGGTVGSGGNQPGAPNVKAEREGLSERPFTPRDSRTIVTASEKSSDEDREASDKFVPKKGDLQTTEGDKYDFNVEDELERYDTYINDYKLDDDMSDFAEFAIKENYRELVENGWATAEQALETAIDAYIAVLEESTGDPMQEQDSSNVEEELALFDYLVDEFLSNEDERKLGELLKDDPYYRYSVSSGEATAFDAIEEATNDYADRLEATDKSENGDNDESMYSDQDSDKLDEFYELTFDLTDEEYEYYWFSQDYYDDLAISKSPRDAFEAVQADYEIYSDLVALDDAESDGGNPATRSQPNDEEASKLDEFYELTFDLSAEEYEYYWYHPDYYDDLAISESPQSALNAVKSDFELYDIIGDVDSEEDGSSDLESVGDDNLSKFYDMTDTLSDDEYSFYDGDYEYYDYLSKVTSADEAFSTLLTDYEYSLESGTPENSVVNATDEDTSELDRFYEMTSDLDDDLYYFYLSDMYYYDEIASDYSANTAYDTLRDDYDIYTSLEESFEEEEEYDYSANNTLDWPSYSSDEDYSDWDYIYE
jgi:hypothetical protein